MNKTFHILLCIFLSIIMFSCKTKITNDPNARLSFSADSIKFDTVFTNQGSSTSLLMVYNRNKQAVRIDHIALAEGANSSFRLNIDGITNETSSVSNITLESGDSLFIFVRASIDPTDKNNPVLVEDNILFALNGQTQNVALQAYGQDVEIIRATIFENDTTLLGLKPYLIYDYVAIDTAKTLTLAAGCRFYFHDGAQFVVFGNLNAQGTLEKPITMQSDRIDNLFADVPYSMVANRWDGMYLVQVADNPEATYDINHLETRSGTVGIYCINNSISLHPQLKLKDSRIHNFGLYGLVVQNMDATITNTEISNCAQYCVYLSGGEHIFTHTTIASYFNNTNVRIQSVGHEDVAAVYIDDLNKSSQPTKASFYNSIITGTRQNNLVVATAFEQQYMGEISHCYLRNDTIDLPSLNNITYYQKDDKVFRNEYYRYQEYVDYDFTLDSLSPCRNIADSVIALDYPLDRQGKNRLADGKPDLGCYEY